MRRVHGIPNHAWSYWAQGLSNADLTIQLCVKSWVSRGGFDRIDVLESKSVYQYLPEGTLPETFSSLPFQLQSDFVRLALLREHGGIWMDASTLVSSNVADWLSLLKLDDGFFFFQNPGKGVGGRLFETGFIASRPQHQFIVDWYSSLASLFSRDRVHGAHSRSSDAPLAYKKIFALMNQYLRKAPHLSALWAKWPLSWLPFYPFFIVHYSGNAVLQQESHSNELARIPMVLAKEYLTLRDISNKRGWDNALESPALQSSPVHDVEFRKPLSDIEVLALRNFVQK